MRENQCQLKLEKRLVGGNRACQNRYRWHDEAGEELTWCLLSERQRRAGERRKRPCRSKAGPMARASWPSNSSTLAARFLLLSVNLPCSSISPLCPSKAGSRPGRMGHHLGCACLHAILSGTEAVEIVGCLDGQVVTSLGSATLLIPEDPQHLDVSARWKLDKHQNSRGQAVDSLW